MRYYQQTPGHQQTGGCICRKIKCGKIIADQRADEPEISCRTSAQPGKTQTINFYNINEAMYLVDLPGYGYAKVSQSEKEKWGKMIERYLHTSKNLKAVFLLIDIRHDPSANDKMMYDWILNNGYEPIIIATKLDKLKRSQVQKNIKAIKEGLKLSKDGIIIPFSAETKQGRDEIWALIDELTGLAATEEA